MQLERTSAYSLIVPRGSASCARALPLLGMVFAAIIGCHDPSREQVERDARDRVRLESIVESDEALDRALKSADDASRAGDDLKAASLLDENAAQASSAAVAEAERQPLETPWGRARRDAILAVMRERRASITAYAQALRGDDIEAKLAAIETQIALQKKAAEAAATALSPAGVADGG